MNAIPGDNIKQALSVRITQYYQKDTVMTENFSKKLYVQFSKLFQVQITVYDDAIKPLQSQSC